MQPFRSAAVWNGDSPQELPLSEPDTPCDFDVVIVGGALAGAASAQRLLEGDPRLKILIVEKSERFSRRVGEATVEVSGYFLTRVLGLTRHLNECHLIKQGFRFWMGGDEEGNLETSSEIGGRYLARVPAYQIDRAVLDEEVLRQAVAAGAELWRPASVRSIELREGERQILEVQSGGKRHRVSARWVVDASGVAAMLARQNGWWQANHDHPTSAVWARWRGVKDLDGLELRRKYPRWADACFGTRGTATNHLMGDGWWAWVIPLKGGDVSAGVVFDQRLLEWPEGGSLGQRLKDFLCRHPAGRELFGDAQWHEGDVHWRRNLAYHAARYAGDGYVLVGDAAAFIDPFYSPGLDWLSFTVTAGTALILDQRKGEAMAGLVDRHNRDFTRAYQRWFEAVYRDKYQYLGDYELLRLAFVLDLGLYYFGVASQPYKMGPNALRKPVFCLPPAVPVYHLMRTYNRRLARMAAHRRARGKLGRRNRGHRFMFNGFTFHPSSSLPLVKGLLKWLWLEMTEGWRTWFQPTHYRREMKPMSRSSAEEAVPSEARLTPN